MVIATVCGGSAPQACPPAAGSSRSSAWRSAFPKGSPGGIAKQTPHRPSSRPDVQSRPACAVLSKTAPPSADIRSADLNDMCTLQLGMLYQLLARAGKNYSSMRCTVYARNFTAVGPGQVKLVQVARFPVVAGHQDEQQHHNTLLLHTEQSWALQGGSAAVDPSAMIEDCLLQREVVALPSSSALVFPLVDCGVLVGLLVVEMDAAAAQEHWGPGGGAAGAAVTAAASGLPRAGMSAASAAHMAGVLSGGLAAAEEMARRPAEGGPGAARGGDSGDPSLRTLAKLDAAASEAHERSRQGLTDEELQCLRLAVPLLSKACGMDARASWQLTQSSMSAAAAAGLLREAQRPLSTLNTFSAMLMPRLKDGDPDKDMAKGIVLQGKRLQDLVWQLEEALHGVALQGQTAAAAAAASMLHVSALGLPPGTTGHPHAHAARPAPPFRSCSALPRDPSPAVQELLQLPRPRPAALPPISDTSEPLAAAAPASTHHPADSLMPSASIPMDGESSRDMNSLSCITTDGAPPAPVLPGRVTFVDRTSASGSSSTPNSTLGAFTIRMPSSSLHGRSTHATGQPMTARGTGTDRPYTLGQHGASMATIDVEMDKCESTSLSELTGSDDRVARNVHPAMGHHHHYPAPGSTATWGWSPSQLHGAGSHLATALSTNLVSALAGVLTAACKLAAVSGIGFIVNSPLSAVLSRRSASSGAAGAGPVKAGARSKSSSSPTGSGSPPSLIPRPPRPLLVGVRAALVQKIVGYMLDIALQCTPRGGQVCVSARQDGAGVQVQVLHSGRMDLQRLHVRSRALTPAALHVSAGGRNDAARGTGEHGGTGLTVLASRPVGAGVATQTPSMATVPVGGSAGAQAGSGVLSVEMAQELAQQAGGHLTVSYPFNMVNAKSGNLDVGTSVEIWFPGPATGN